MNNSWSEKDSSGRYRTWQLVNLAMMVFNPAPLLFFHLSVESGDCHKRHTDERVDGYVQPEINQAVNGYPE
jgi:hypothetical protein